MMREDSTAGETTSLKIQDTSLIEELSDEVAANISGGLTITINGGATQYPLNERQADDLTWGIITGRIGVTIK